MLQIKSLAGGVYEQTVWLSDEAWAAIESHLPKNQPGVTGAIPQKVDGIGSIQLGRIVSQGSEGVWRRRRIDQAVDRDPRTTGDRGMMKMMVNLVLHGFR